MVRCISFLAMALLCHSLFAQIELTVRPVVVITQIVAPEIFNSHLLAGNESQPSKQSAVLLTATGPYKSLDVEVESKPNFDLVDLIRAKDRPNDWLLIGAGKFRITVYGYDPERGQARKRQDIDLGPQPSPGPSPNPDPPAPDSLPIEGKGFRVLIVYESSTLSKILEAQRQVLTSTKIREYLNHKCQVEEDRQFGWRVLDQHADMQHAHERWKKAMARSRTGLPWILISNGTQGFEGPLPTSIDATLLLLKRFGGE